MLLMSNISKVYPGGSVALEDVNVHIEPGEFVFVVGPSGAGKSTFFKMLFREIKPTTGSIVVNGVDILELTDKEIPYYRRQLGIIFQDYRLLPDRTVYENVAFAMQVIETPHRKIKRRVMNVLDLVGLRKRANAYPNELSGGEQQRIAIARVMLKDTPIVILDEATAFADPDNETRVQKAFSEMAAMGKTLIMIAHRLSSVTGADCIYVMEDGHISESGTHSELLERGGKYAAMWQQYVESVKWNIK